MNANIQQQTRNYLKELIVQCTEPQQLLFKRMYSHNDLNKDIEAVVQDMESGKLDNAVTQVERTLKII